MAAVHAFILFHIVFGFLHQGLGLISDYKLCGDPECESMISRVQALRDNNAKDCRFLNFKKGDIITVYYKLTGKRNDLWAGSIEKLSGLFPKDAIKVDQLFIDEKKEIQVPTQEYDFICFDDNGLVIERSNEIDDLEDLSQDIQENDFNDVQDKPTETEESEPRQISVKDVSDQNSPKTTEKGGSSWIGSAVSGWFGENEQSNDEPQEELSEVSFKSRKIVMDLDENRVEEKTNSGTFGWIRGELTNAFGFGNKDPKMDTQDNIENPTNDEDTSFQQSSSWISDVLDLSEDNSKDVTKHEAEKVDENTNMEDESILKPSQNLDVVDNIQRDENNPDDSVENKDSPLEDRRTEKEKEEEQAGWYGNIYNRITNLYREEQTKDDEDDGGKVSLSESPGSAVNTENIETKVSESSSQSIFSVSGMTSMLKLPFQADTAVKRDEEQTEKKEDPGKEDFDEEQNNNEDQEEGILTDIDEHDSNPTDIDVLSVASDNVEKLDEESNMTKDSTESQILVINSADNLTDKVQRENIADIFEGQVEQDTSYVQSDEEKTGKEEDSGISEDDCVHEACLDVNTQISTTEVENNEVIEDRTDINDSGNPQNEPVSEEKDLSANRVNAEDDQNDEQDIQEHEDWTSSETKKTTLQNQGFISEEYVETQKGEGQIIRFHQVVVFVEVTMKELASIVDKVVSSLPDDIRPGPDLYGLPWEAVVFTGFLGFFTLLLFSCRFINSIRSRLYASKEKQMAQKVAELLDEKCKVLETFSEVKQKFDKLESTLQNNGMSAQAAEKDSLEVASQKLEQSNAQMKKEIERLQEELSQQNKARKQQEDQLAELEQILRNLEEEAKERKSQLEQDNTTLKIHEINTERLQKNLQASKEEHAMLLESKAQLVQEAEDWGERLGELEEEMKMCERSHSGMLEDCANKDDRIKSLTECLLKMRDWDSEDESCVDGSTNTAGAENGDSSDLHQKQKVQKLIEAAKMSADLKSMEEDKNRVFAKLADEIKAKEDLQEGIKQLEEQKEALESESANYASESQKLQQKLQIMTEMYQENELKLHRMLTVEEKERLQKEEKLNKAGKKISLAAEELNTYRQRAKDLEEELERTSHAYKNQITSHEKKAHDNWLAARAADRDLADVKRENAHLRQKLTDAQFKFDILEKDVREGRPLFRGERSPYGPSPLSRPSSETRAFLSPPTLMDGPPRLSPQFMGPGRASRGVVEPPSGGPDFERSGPHSDSGSLSPSWDRERRGPPPAPGHPLPDPGLPFRRPPPGPYPMGPLAPRPPLPPEPYFGEKSDSSFLRNSSSISENESREGPHSMPGDMRLPPDPDSRMGPPPGPPLMGMPPLMDPRDPHFPHRGPYGPPEFFRGPAGPPMGMRGPLPPGMFPRAPMPLPQHMGYLPPRHPSDNFPPGPPPRPSPPGSEQPPDQSPSPHDVI
ncbi:cTAGE family member 8 isoform X5 [Puntigrus tetrazona]|uniref:cTAGE family member 8 isoform X5 n=1 Tax=Puntigrus tetrazona TaxID=1606681 RepID=UPI001C88E400|nr:cTAGE family member 8 isoform X5 [Puntigrus tetrazona]